MKIKKELTGKSTIVAFQIGRGGQYYNPGHKSYVGTYDIKQFTDDLFMDYEKTRDILKNLHNHHNIQDFVIENYRLPDERAKKLFEKLGLDFGEQIYVDQNGNHVGLTESEAESGIGCINIDNEYDTTYTKYIHTCDLSELKLIDNENLLIEYIEYYYNIDLTKFRGDLYELINALENGYDTTEYLIKK